MRGILVAVDANNVIGKNGTIPWHYRADLARFKRLTVGTTVIMGRATWDSLPKKPLPDRRNVVVTSRPIDGIDCFPSVALALRSCAGDVWFIGGARIYEEAMSYCDVLDVTYVPDVVAGDNLVYFPEIDEAVFEPGPLLRHEDDAALHRRVYRRRASSADEVAMRH